MAMSVQRLVESFAQRSERPDLRVQRVLRCIASGNQQSRHFVAFGGDALETQAAASTRRWASGSPLGPVDGLMLAVKDNIDVAGFATTAGTRMGALAPVERDAPLVQQLMASGALVIGKVNMNEAALGVDGDNPTHGYCANPRWSDHSSGGSSSGSAAAVAAGTADLALGTDTMGSVRIPAAFCGLVGYKPSAGHLPTQGVVPLCHSLDTVGVLARAVQDVRRLLAVVKPVRGSDRHIPLHGLRFGVPLALGALPMAAPVERAWTLLMERMRDEGMRCTPLPVAGWDPGALRRDALLLSERDAHAHWSQVPQAFSSEGLSPALQDLLRYPGRAGPDRLRRAEQAVAASNAAWTHALSQVDVVLMPTSLVDSFARGGPVPVATADLTVPANVAGAPAVSLPLGPGHPRIGVQVIASRNRDDHLLSVAQALENWLNTEWVTFA